MSDYEYDIPMPGNYRQLLLKLVEQSQKRKTLTARGFIVCDLQWQFSMGNEIWTVDNIQGNPIMSFDCFGLISLYYQEQFTLTPNAFKWAAYQKKSRLEKWWARLPGNVKDVMIIISFILSLVGVILSSYLAYLQILEKLKPVP